VQAERVSVVESADLVVSEWELERAVQAAGAAVLDAKTTFVRVRDFGELDGEPAWAGSDLVDAAFGGGCQPNGEPGRAPLRPPAWVGDQLTGLAAALSALVALYAREALGVGQRVEVAGADCWGTVHTAVGLLEYIFRNRVAVRSGRRFGRRYPFELLSCGDGDMRLICVVGREWKRALEMMGNPAWAEDPRFADRQVNQAEHADELDDLVGAWMSPLTRREIFERARAYAVPWAPVQTVDELPEDAQLAARGFWSRDRGPLLPRFPGQLRRSPPSTAETESAGAADPRVAGTGESSLPLAGVRVIDFGWAWAGSLTGSILADLGAEVIKVESRRRLDPMRMDTPLVGSERDIEQGGLHHNVNRGKRSIVVDISRPEGAELVRELARHADAVIENLSVDALPKYGLGPDDLLAVNPALVYLSNSAVGRAGPLADMRSYAPVITALSGVDALTGYPGEPPVGLQIGIADSNAGMFGAVALMALLLERRRSGLGGHLDVSQLESMIYLVAPHVLAQDLGVAPPAPCGNRDPLAAPHGVFRCTGDDNWVAITCTSDEEWAGLVSALGSPAWAREPELATLAGRREAEDSIEAALSEWCARREKWDVAAELQRAGVPAAPLLDTGERLETAYFWQRELYANVDHPRVGAEVIYALPWKFDRTPGRVERPAPFLGQDTVDVLTSVLGLTASEVEALSTDGVLS
jgi:crotonobetainyl-CoA:carnitine CoA-transferase CaiB-like acyl-CoA transferase